MEDIRLAASKEQLFILDIGTRNVIGIAGHKEGTDFVADAWAIESHPKRAMIDGQIEDIAQVAKVAARVKDSIEEQMNITFSSVSIAAAGRALKTCRAKATSNFSSSMPITLQMVYALENTAINNARIELSEDEDNTPYYCVGHSVVRYLLDDYPFSTLVGHSGSVAEVEVIATFLPTEVVDSLFQCMGLLDLSIDTLTLEPIAAMRAVIPRDLQLLNLALVDIGAGTSDIAVSANSAVSGYTMATIAGDEITEALIKQFLVDFSGAEKLKLALQDGGPFEYTDILGFSHNPTSDDILSAVSSAVDSLADVISQKILECNESSPAAVFLVGGGSKTPGLAEKIANILQLDAKRVAISGTRFSDCNLDNVSGLIGPEFATPLGIALSACDNTERSGTVVTINNEHVKLFAGETFSIMDALLAGGYRYSDIMGRNGRSLTFTLNGERCVLRGTPYTTAEISLDGKLASLSTPVEDGDAIDIIPATNGENACATIAKYANGELPIQIVLNNKPFYAGLIAQINGKRADLDFDINDGDDVQIFVLRTVGELCAAANISAEGAIITVNGSLADVSTVLSDGDVISCTVLSGSDIKGDPASYNVTPSPVPMDLEEIPTPPEIPLVDTIPDFTSDPPQPPTEEPAAPITTNPFSRYLRIDLNGESMMLPPKPTGQPHRLIDMLELADIDLQNPKGALHISINGQNVSYTEELLSGDVIKIHWIEPFEA